MNLATYRTMGRVERYINKAYTSIWKQGLGSTTPHNSTFLCRGTCSMVARGSKIIPHLLSPDLCLAEQPSHVQEVFKQLKEKGVLKISLGFQDSSSQYLERLLFSLHKLHGHQLPIKHSAARGWFWDIRPSTVNFQTAHCQARSETMEMFAWHTDCSYENPPPRYFALHILQPDRYGGGTLSLMNVEQLSGFLSASTRAALMRPDYRITVPPEFIKDSKRQNVTGSLLISDEEGRPSMMRFREDILAPLNERASEALKELKQVLQGIDSQSNLPVRLTSNDLSEKTIILVDNRRWLHCRTHVKDAGRHLRRVRWDAISFPGLAN